MITVTALQYSPDTNDWTHPVEYQARDKMEAIRWANFWRPWYKNIVIHDIDERTWKTD